ncbi:hypothetical protein FLL45_14785 [Aliikangiella marina]|uniref:Uncharacterized protein n=1 Tax=Aliikangiella marina TaxID=1712262 RepID=A0A545TA78_9GAMM|nr:DUF6776 family protein [Aliikangiella marina]TQV74120.1 hypothetical protein FLL45_14785 [Aliikangiella marina]
MQGPQLVIKEQKPTLWYVGIAALALVVILITYFIGRFHDKAIQEALNENVANLQQELDKVQRAYLKANESLVMQAQTAKVDNQSNQQLVETVKQLQESERQLQSELRFYRNIMAPELDKQGLTIAEFDLIKPSPESNPRFKLVLTQVGRHEQFLKGEVQLKVHGKVGEVVKVYPFRELGTFSNKDFQFQFRYFQNIEGELSLPEGFTAEYITIEARTRGLRKNQTAQTQVNWTI